MKVVSHSELKEIIKIAYKTKLSLFVHGTMGIGKSTVIKETAKELAKEMKREYAEWNKVRDKEKLFEHPEKYFVVADFRLSQIDPSDIKGIPMPSNGSVVWKIPKVFEWFTLENSAGIIFFDEINLSPNTIQSSVYQIIYDKEIGEKPLSDKVIIVSAGNRAEDRANIYELPAPLSNRFIHVELKIPSIEEWTEWALRNGIDNRIIAFLNFRQALLYKFDRNIKDHAFCTPRTWEFASKLIKDIDSKNLDLIETLVASSVGEATAIEFVSFLKLKESVDIDEIIKNPEKIREIDKIDMKYAVISELVGRYEKNKKLLEKMIQIANNLDPIEVRYLLLRMIKEKDEDYFKKNVIRCKGWEVVRDTLSKYLL